mmetsp:Transcript_7407/g.14055  ORF Transcript_7407/g.14055 Transcript_7407/m.14055 type:complete len:344 (+) Transcript_7407:149-1180(+)
MIPTINNLPGAIMRHHVAKFLAFSDMCQLSITSKKLHSQLPVSIMPPRKVLTEFSRIDYHNGNADYGPYEMDYGFEIPLPSHPQVACHSIRVSMSWRDQGLELGQKGYFLIMASDKETGGRLGRIVFASPYAPHSSQSLHITFMPKRDQSYHLWYVVGGGGGHSLNLYNVTVQAIVYDEPSRSFFKAYNFVAKRNVFLPWDVATSLMSPPQVSSRDPFELETTLASASHLLKQGEPLLSHMISLFAHSGVSERDLTLRLIELIRSILDDVAHELYLYDRCCLCDFEDNRYQNRVTLSPPLNGAEYGIGKNTDGCDVDVEYMDIDHQYWGIDDDMDFDPASMEW